MKALKFRETGSFINLSTLSQVAFVRMLKVQRLDGSYQKIFLIKRESFIKKMKKICWFFEPWGFKSLYPQMELNFFKFNSFYKNLNYNWVDAREVKGGGL